MADPYLPPKDSWEAVIHDACVSAWVEFNLGEDKKALLRRLIEREQQFALDPAVSEEAAALVTDGLSRLIVTTELLPCVCGKEPVVYHNARFINCSSCGFDVICSKDEQSVRIMWNAAMIVLKHLRKNIK